MTGFEGVEKRPELVFDKKDSLRQTFTKEMWEEVLKPVECFIKDQFLMATVNSYLLSTSSLFVFDDRIIIKTCGETNLFEAIPGILRPARQEAIAVKYTRGTYFWPEKQPLQHQHFEAESLELEKRLKILESKVKAEMEEDKNLMFHFYAAGSSSVTEGVTVEILMKELDKTKSAVFFKSERTESMTRLSGIDKIFPESTICDYEFTGCGYSMNGIQGDSVYTIHVTPEDEFSFASFETYRCKFKGKDDFNHVVKKVLDCFGPACFIVTVHSSSTMELFDLEVDNRTCKSKVVKDLGPWGPMVGNYSF